MAAGDASDSTAAPILPTYGGSLIGGFPSRSLRPGFQVSIIPDQSSWDYRLRPPARRRGANSNA